TVDAVGINGILEFSRDMKSQAGPLIGLPAKTGIVFAPSGQQRNMELREGRHQGKQPMDRPSSAFDPSPGASACASAVADMPEWNADSGVLRCDGLYKHFRVHALAPRAIL